MRKRAKNGIKQREHDDSSKPVSATSVYETTGDIFPWYSQYVIFIFSLVLRIVYVSQPSNWWILHPDEVYQSLEVAHSEVYGYGFRPYEYLTSQQHVNDTNIRQRELQLGMSAMRSFLFPGFFVFISFVLNSAKISVQPFLAWKLSHTCITSCLPLAVYKFTKSLFTSHDASCMSAVLVATSVHLNVFGTHTLMNSFLSPFVFVSISTLILPTPTSLPVCPDSITENTVSRSASICSNDKIANVVSQCKHQPHSNSSIANGDTCSTNISVCRTRIMKDTCFGSIEKFGNLDRTSSQGKIKPKCKYKNDDLLSRNKPLIHNSDAGDTFTGLNSSCGYLETVYHVLTCGYKTTIYFLSKNINAKDNIGNDAPSSSNTDDCDIANDVAVTNKSAIGSKYLYSVDSLLDQFQYLPNGVQGMKKINLAKRLGERTVVNRAWFHIWRENWSSVRRSISTVISTFILSVCCYIRPDLLLFSSLVFLPHCNIQHFKRHLFLYGGIGATLALSVGLYDDFSSYGFGVISPLNWFRFNVWNQHSSAIFGTMGLSFYLEIVFWQCRVNLLLLLVTAVLLCYTILKSRQRKWAMTLGKLCVSLVLLFVSYSLQGHKESRHIHNLFCLFYVLVAVVFVNLLNSSMSIISSRIFVLFVSLGLIVSGFIYFPSAQNKTNKPWIYGDIYNSNDVNACLDYVGRTNDVSGVFLDTSIHMTGGYSILNRNVPILALLIHEFYEFDNASRVETAIQPGTVSSVSIFSKSSNFISVLNTPYLLKHLISSPKYNYLVLQQDRAFIDYGYQVAFTSGNMKVLRRSFKSSEENKLLKLANGIRIGSNATILNYEGTWLVNLGASEEALLRLEASLSIGESLISNYQLISSIYYKKGDRTKARNVMRRCCKLYNKIKCTERIPQTILHQNYNISL